MLWINGSKTAGAAQTVLLLTLAGCVAQDTIIPKSEQKMVDIYRGALHEARSSPAATISPEDICRSLELDEDVAQCEEKVAKQSAAAYREIDAQPATDDLDYISYTRTVDTELNNLFPRLANPDLVIYVYPHLATRTRAPIPGYTTVIPLYEKVEYKLPGESLRVTPHGSNAP